MIECTPSSLASVVGSREHTFSYELGTYKYNHEIALLVELVNDFGQDGPERSLVKQGRTRRAIGLVRPTHSKVVYYFFKLLHTIDLGGSANKL